MNIAADLLFSTHADRLFIQAGKSPLRGKRGLPASPSPWNEAHQHTWSSWEDVPCVLLLGEPGIGKSREFLHFFQKLSASGQAAFMSRWQDWCDGDDVFATLNDREGFFNALKMNKPVYWFIDALDEGRIKTDRAFDIIKRGLRTLSELGLLDGLRLRISCRSRDWRPTEANQLTPFFPDTGPENAKTEGVVTLRLLPLDDAAVRVLALEKLGTEVAVNRFMDALVQRHVVPLSGQPLLLGMMLQLFQRGDETLGHDRTGLYARAVEHLNVEHNSKRKEQAPPRTMPAKRIAIAKASAVNLVFSGKDAITVPDKDSQDDRTLNAACIGAERDEILETLNTGLFTQDLGNGFSFIHRSLAEYLAAVHLSELLEAGLPLGRLLPFFPIEYDLIPGPLRETAAWLAGLNSRFRSWLIEHDPITAAQGDTVRYTSAEREELISILTKHFGNRTWQREFDRFGDLARSVSDNALRQLLLPEKSLAVSCMAMEMIEAAEVKKLFPDLLRIALDSTANSTLRTKAAIILAKHAATEFAKQLRPLLELPENEDGDDEIGGALLYYLYPRHLTTAEALIALHAPRNRSLIGLYSLFWNHEFLNRIPFERLDRHLALDATVALLATSSDSIELRHITLVIKRLLLVELKEQAQNVGKLGGWLIELSAWIRQHGTFNEGELKQLMQALRTMTELKAELFRWQLQNWPQGKEFTPWWHFPFYESIATDDDTPVLIELCSKYSLQPEIGKGLFQLLVGLTNHIPQIVSLEILEALAKTNIHYLNFWDSVRICDLDGPVANNDKQNRKYKAAQANKEAALKAHAQSNVEAFRAGNINMILNLIYEVNLDVFGEAPIQEIAEQHGYNVAQAVREGLVSIWDNLSDASSLWPYSNELPNVAIAAGFGYRLKRPEISTLNHQQIDFLIWRMLHHDDDTSTLLTTLWENHRISVLRRVLETLKDESSLPEDAHPSVWNRLTQLDEFPSGLIDELVNHVISENIPTQTRARHCALKILLKSSRRPEAAKVIIALVHSEWSEQTLPAPWTEYAALSALAALWLIDADKAYDLLANTVLVGSRHHIRAVGFINGLQELLGNHSGFNSTWPETVPWKSYAQLFPMLYAHHPTREPKRNDGRVTANDQFSHARDSLVNHLSKAPVELSRTWFAAWKDDQRFGAHRDWFANIYAELGQRQADGSWSPLSTDTVERVLGKNAFLVRNDIDFVQLINEITAQQLIPAFRSDYNLVPLLWEGKKSNGGRKHRDEKALQTAIYGQLIPMVRSCRVIGAREPEILDAKKPDIRLSYVLDSGTPIDVPIEIKWSDHQDLWDAPESQVLKKYMQDPRVRHGIYLIGWAGPSMVKAGPNGEKPQSAAILRTQLQKITNDRLAGTKKTITVHIVDASIIDV